MNKKNRTIPVLLGLNLLVTAAILIFLTATHTGIFQNGQEDVNYTLYIGLNDKDTYTQKIDTNDAREIVDGICLKYADGFTSSSARGSWTDENGVPTHENTLVYMFSFTDEETITAIMDEVLEALNQSSILVLTDTVRTEYYGGAE